MNIKLKNSDILEVKTSSPLNSIARKLFHAWGGHAAYYADGCVWESFFYIRKFSILKYLDKHKEVRIWRFKDELTKSQSEAITQYIVDRKGKYWDLFAVLWQGFAKIFGIKTHRNKWDDDDKWFCLEIITDAYLSVFPDLFPGKVGAEVTFQEFFNSGNFICLGKINIDEVL